MDNPIREPELWVEELVEKHECGGYDRSALTTEIIHDGPTMRLIHPFSLDAAAFLSATLSDSGELLSLIAKQPRPEGDFPVAALPIVASRRAANTYAVVDWHELYPWAFKSLGMETAIGA